MGRPARVTYPGAVIHVTSRGNNKSEIFLDDQDRQRYLDLLAKFKKKHDFYILAYILMDNHTHLLLQVGESPISKIMQTINTAYSVYFNSKNSRSGHLFQGRFHSSIVEAQSYLLAVTVYIHLNPVRAGLVMKPEMWRWSSCGIYLGSEENNFVDLAEASRLQGIDNLPESYPALLHDKSNDKLPITIKNGIWFVGSKRFASRLSMRLSK